MSLESRITELERMVGALTEYEALTTHSSNCTYYITDDTTSNSGSDLPSTNTWNSVVYGNGKFVTAINSVVNGAYCLE